MRAGENLTRIPDRDARRAPCRRARRARRREHRPRPLSRAWSSGPSRMFIGLYPRIPILDGAVRHVAHPPGSRVVRRRDTPRITPSSRSSPLRLHDTGDVLVELSRVHQRGRRRHRRRRHTSRSDALGRSLGQGGDQVRRVAASHGAHLLLAPQAQGRAEGRRVRPVVTARGRPEQSQQGCARDSHPDEGGPLRPPHMHARCYLTPRDSPHQSRRREAQRRAVQERTRRGRARRAPGPLRVGQSRRAMGRRVRRVRRRREGGGDGRRVGQAQARAQRPRDRDVQRRGTVLGATRVQVRGGERGRVG